MKNNDGWMLYPMFMPEPETEVDITYKKNVWNSKTHMFDKEAYFTARAIYEDGTVPVDESRFDWDDYVDYEYDEEKDEYLIPEGWWEAVSFNEYFSQVDCEVIAWKPVADPYIPEE